jgi:hypothetical protein
MMKGALVLIALTTLAACASQPPPTAFDPPGLFLGLFHGLTALPALVAGLFADIRIYAFPNSGWTYDLGFMLGGGFWVMSAAGANR